MVPYAVFFLNCNLNLSRENKEDWDTTHDFSSKLYPLTPDTIEIELLPNAKTYPNGKAQKHYS